MLFYIPFITLLLEIGGAIKGYRIDIFLESEKACYIWGKRKVKIKILRKGKIK